MKKKRLLLIMIVFLLINTVLAVSNNSINVERKGYQYEMTQEKDIALFKVKLVRRGIALFGRERWKKGEKIVVSVRSIDSDAGRLSIGIVRAEDMSKGWSYDSYGEVIGKESVEHEGSTLEFVVPFDGEYGILVNNADNEWTVLDRLVEFFKSKYVSVEFDVNKTFINPLVK